MGFGPSAQEQQTQMIQEGISCHLFLSGTNTKYCVTVCVHTHTWECTNVQHHKTLPCMPPYPYMCTFVKCNALPCICTYVHICSKMQCTLMLVNTHPHTGKHSHTCTLYACTLGCFTHVLSIHGYTDTAACTHVPTPQFHKCTQNTSSF